MCGWTERENLDELGSVGHRWSGCTISPSHLRKTNQGEGNERMDFVMNKEIRLTGVAVRVVGRHTAPNTESVRRRLKQTHKLLVPGTRIWPTMRVHLSTIIQRILRPNRRINTSSHLDILSGIVLEVVCREDVALGHLETTVLLLAMAVHGSTALVGGNGADAVSGHEGAELVSGIDGGDNGLGFVLCCAGHWFVGQDCCGGSCDGSDEEGLLQEHFVVC